MEQKTLYAILNNETLSLKQAVSKRFSLFEEELWLSFKNKNNIDDSQRCFYSLSILDEQEDGYFYNNEGYVEYVVDQIANNIILEENNILSEELFESWFLSEINDDFSFSFKEIFLI